VLCLPIVLLRSPLPMSKRSACSNSVLIRSQWPVYFHHEAVKSTIRPSIERFFEALLKIQQHNVTSKDSTRLKQRSGSPSTSSALPCHTSSVPTLATYSTKPTCPPYQTRLHRQSSTVCPSPHRLSVRTGTRPWTSSPSSTFAARSSTPASAAMMRVKITSLECGQ
jgi:hypothetical protein